MSGQMHDVLVSPEILATIFAHVEPLDLLVNVQRVSKTWQFIVKASSSIQRRLFLAPMPAKQDDLVRELNPFIQKTFRAWFKVLGFRITNTNQYSNDYSFAFMGRHGDQRVADMRAEASWRKMLPVQPPPSILEVIKIHPSGVMREPGQPIGEVAIFESKGGVRMGTLYDLGWETTHKPYAKFACLWKMFPLDRGGAVEDNIFVRQERLQAQQRIANVNRNYTGSKFKLEDKITLLMDLSMPLPGMDNAMKPHHKSNSYHPVEERLEFREITDRSELSHLAMMCNNACKRH